MASQRLAAFMAWSGLTQSDLAARIGVHQTFVGRLLAGSRAPGLDVAVAIERVTAEPREDGERWPEGPIAVEEWVASDEHTSTVGADAA
jgi:transcriptional regulator with XRE-family HTH domain